MLPANSLTLRLHRLNTSLGEHHSPFQGSVQMAELHGRIRHDETKLAAEHAQHSAAAKDLVQAHEQILELKRRTRVAVSIAVTIRLSHHCP